MGSPIWPCSSPKSLCVRQLIREVYTQIRKHIDCSCFTYISQSLATEDFVRAKDSRRPVMTTDLDAEIIPVGKKLAAPATTHHHEEASAEGESIPLLVLENTASPNLPGSTRSHNTVASADKSSMTHSTTKTAALDLADQDEEEDDLPPTVLPLLYLFGDSFAFHLYIRCALMLVAEAVCPNRLFFYRTHISLTVTLCAQQSKLFFGENVVCIAQLIEYNIALFLLNDFHYNRRRRRSDSMFLDSKLVYICHVARLMLQPYGIIGDIAAMPFAEAHRKLLWNEAVFHK